MSSRLDGRMPACFVFEWPQDAPGARAVVAFYLYLTLSKLGKQETECFKVPEPEYADIC